MAKKKETKKVEPPPECYFAQDSGTGKCSGVVEFCYGCKQNVCEGHAVNGNLPFGGHQAYDHLEESEDG